MKSLFERLGVPYELAEDGMYYPVLSLPESESPDMENMAGRAFVTYRSIIH